MKKHFRVLIGIVTIGLVVSSPAALVPAFGEGTAGSTAVYDRIPAPPTPAERSVQAGHDVDSQLSCTDIEGGKICVESGVDMAYDGFPDEFPTNPNARSADELTPVGLVDFPAECVDSLNYWTYLSRTERCLVTTNLATQYAGTSMIVGRANYYHAIYHYTSTSSTTHAVQHEFGVTGVTGAFAASANLTTFCHANCTPSHPPYSTGIPVVGAHYRYATYLNTPVEPGSSSNAFVRSGVRWTGISSNPNGYAETQINHSATCDDKLGARAAGCVIDEYVPTFTISSTSAPTVASHVQSAIASGLPSRLTRLQETSFINQNRQKSCGSATPITGLSCDEYPFASTIQGAYFQDLQGGTARSFPFCNFTDPPSTGPIGYSRCMVTQHDNSSAGGSLGGFYNANRVVQLSKFDVEVD